MRNWINDVTFDCRMAAKNPWMTLAADVAIGGGMAVTIAGFTLLRNSYFAAPPFDDAHRIVAVRDIEQRIEYKDRNKSAPPGKDFRLRLMASLRSKASDERTGEWP
jgi:hypothetical protein